MQTDLENIKEEFEKLYGKPLVSWVEQDTNGDYRKLLAAIVNGGVSPP